MALVKINNHVEQAEDRLLQQYKESRVFNIFLDAIIAQVQVIEDQCDLLYRERSLLTAYGYQLDGIGKIVGLKRNGLDDEDYRDALIAQIEINVSGGEPESIINAIRKILRPKTIDYFDIYPAYYQLFVQTDETANNLAPLVQSMTPAGVGKAIITLGTEGTPFKFGGLTTYSSNYAVDNNDNILQVNDDGDLLEVTTTTQAIPRNGAGFGGVILNKAYLDVGNGNLYATSSTDLLELKLSNANEDYTVTETGGRLGGMIT